MDKTFVFAGYKANLIEGKASFFYKLKVDGKVLEFEEKILFPPTQAQIPDTLLNSLLGNLMLILGISYWKTYCPKKIEFKSLDLNQEQAEFWNTVYTKGLGEFFYKNQLDFRGFVNFPYSSQATASATPFPRQDRSLVGIGGGKDSIVTAELMKKAGKAFDLLADDYEIQKEVARKVGKEDFNLKRFIDPKLLELNKTPGVYNGHIPISVYYAFIGLFGAALYDYRYFIVSNEKSANYGNVSYLGEVANHQWSKSEEFEEMLQNYTRNFISPDIHYFSLLRPFTEIKIMQIFSRYNQYFGTFSSCNTNFKIVGPGSKKWCGSCAKCSFVFSMMAAFVSKKDVIGVFGKNLLEDENLVQTFRELFGLTEAKPFDCVGTPEEMQLAFYYILQKGEYKDAPIMKLFANEVLPQILDVKTLEKELFLPGPATLIPKEFLDVIKSV